MVPWSKPMLGGVWKASITVYTQSVMNLNHNWASRAANHGITQLVSYRNNFQSNNVLSSIQVQANQSVLISPVTMASIFYSLFPKMMKLNLKCTVICFSGFMFCLPMCFYGESPLPKWLYKCQYGGYLWSFAFGASLKPTSLGNSPPGNSSAVNIDQ